MPIVQEQMARAKREEQPAVDLSKLELDVATEVVKHMTDSQCGQCGRDVASCTCDFGV